MKEKTKQNKTKLSKQKVNLKLRGADRYDSNLTHSSPGKVRNEKPREESSAQYPQEGAPSDFHSDTVLWWFAQLFLSLSCMSLTLPPQGYYVCKIILLSYQLKCKMSYVNDKCLYWWTHARYVEVSSLKSESKEELLYLLFGLPASQMSAIQGYELSCHYLCPLS